MQIDSSFRINSVFLISSNPPGEEGQARRLEDDLAILSKSSTPEFCFIHKSPENLQELLELFQSIEHNIQFNNAMPIIHFHMHGNQEKGLLLKNGEYAEWNWTSQWLRKFNTLMENNLCVVSTACFGFNLIKELTIEQTTPFYCLIAAQDEISFGDVDMRGSGFYRVLMNTSSIDEAYKTVSDLFSYFHCEKMLAVSLSRYIKEKCKGKCGQGRREDLLTQAIDSGIDPTVENLKELRQQIKVHIKPDQNLLERYVLQFLHGRTIKFTLDDLLNLIESEINQ